MNAAIPNPRNDRLGGFTSDARLLVLPAMAVVVGALQRRLHTSRTDLAPHQDPGPQT